MAYSLLIVWALCVALACIGFGKAVLRGIRCPEPALIPARNRLLGWVLASVLGVSVFLALGGILNLAHLIRRPILIGVVALGCCLLIAALLRERESLHASLAALSSFTPSRGWKAAVGVAILVLLAARMAVCVYTRGFSETDDLNAYLCYPVKMLAAGDFAADPFSERRVTSSLGGSVYLQAVVLCVDENLRAINLPDGALGLLLFAAVCAALCRSLRLPPDRSLWVFLIFALTPDYRVNTTSVVLPAALLMGSLLIVTTDALGPPLSLRRYFALGLTVAAACTLKSTVIPGFALLCCALLVFEFFRSPGVQVLRAGGVLAGTALAALAPWMIDSKIKSGTALYPILGRGYHYTAYARLPPLPSGALLGLTEKAAIISAPYLLAAAFLLVRPGRFLGRYRSATLALLVGTALGNLAVSYGTAGDSILRYNMTMVWPANVFLAMVLLAAAPRRQEASAELRWPGWLPAAWVAWALVFVLLTGNAWTIALGRIRDRTPLWLPGERQEAKNLQAAIPVGAPLLTHMTRSYTADFKRNPVFIADYPGMAGPPPGMPIGQGPEPLARYLLQHSIRYVAYSYYDQAGLPRSFFEARGKSWGRSPWPRQQAAAALDFQDNLSALAKTRQHLFDDGRVYVLDLMSAKSAPPDGPTAAAAP